MGIFDRFKHQAEELVGKAKEAVGNLTDDDKLKTEGQTDQASGQVKQGVDEVKDQAASAVQDVKDKLDEGKS